MNQVIKCASTVALSASLLFAGANQAVAQQNSASNYPDRPITIIVPFGPGTTDLAARFIAKKITEATGKPVIVENKAGADGVIGTQEVLKRPPDGYTFIVGTSTTHAANLSLHKKLPYDPVKDFVPITGLVVGGVVLAVSPEFPAKSVQELVALAKKNPGKYTFGASNSSSRGGGESMRLHAGVDILYVNYKSLPAALTDTIGGQIDMVFGDMPTTMPLIRAGKLRALGVSTRQRLPDFSDIPTIAEQGVPGYEVQGWVAAFAPKGTPPQIVEKLNQLIVPAMRSLEAKNMFGPQGWADMSGSPEALAKVQAEDIALWANLVKSAGIEPL